MSFEVSFLMDSIAGLINSKSFSCVNVPIYPILIVFTSFLGVFSFKQLFKEFFITTMFSLNLESVLFRLLVETVTISAFLIKYSIVSFFIENSLKLGCVSSIFIKSSSIS